MPYTFALEEKNNFCNFLGCFLLVLKDISPCDEIIAFIANIFLKSPRLRPSGSSPYKEQMRFSQK